MIRIAFAVVLILVCLIPVVAAEIWLRHVGLGDPILYARNTSYRYAPRPNQRVERQRHAIVTVDGHGLRGVRDWSEPADLKVLFIGDSVTWGGTYIDDRETFAHRTCELLRSALAMDVLCGNAGVNAYGTDNMTARLTFDPVAKQADIIVVVVIHGDTIRGLADLTSFYYFTKAPPAPFPAIWEALGYALWRATAAMTRQGGRIDRSHDVAVADQSLERLYDALDEHRRKGQQVLVVYSPARSEIEDDGNRLGDFVRASIAQSGLPYLDASSLMAEENLDAMYHDSVHLEVAGHEIYGEALAARIAGLIRRDGPRVGSRG